MPMVSLIYSMINIPRIRARRRVVEVLKASQTHNRKPEISETQKAAVIRETYPSCIAVKMLANMNSAIRKRFRARVVFTCGAIITSSHCEIAYEGEKVAIRICKVTR
jgi:hypothetical protein